MSSSQVDNYLDVINLWKLITEHFHEEEKCGFCWKFAAPLADSEANKQDIEREEDEDELEDCPECCVYVMVTELSTNQINQFNQRTSFLNSQVDDYTFTALIVKSDDIGTNTYNEEPGHPVEESKWETILKPLQRCLTGDELRDFCKFNGEHIQVTNWSMTVVKNYLGNNYTGWRVRGTLRKRVI